MKPKTGARAITAEPNIKEDMAGYQRLLETNSENVTTWRGCSKLAFKQSRP
jgi:hypothetical protein